MYTVIIAEKKHFDAIERNKLYFKPFLDRLNKEFAFCEWNPEGETLYECVPALIKTVGRHKTWRAVILKDDSFSLSKNPFDAINYQRIEECESKNRFPHPLEDTDDAEYASSAEQDNQAATSEMFESWKQECNDRIKAMLSCKEEIFREALKLPFQRLVTCFCYIPDDLPDKSVSKKDDIKDFVDQLLDPTNYEKHLSDLEHFYHLEQDRLKDSLRRECVEEMLPGDRVSRRKGSMGIVLPSEVFCFAERTTETGFFDARIYWENHTGFEYSDFVGRNMYFDKMRFIASDVLPSTHQDYRYDQIRFLYNFLLFSLNEVPSGTVLPRRLYCLESENNEKSLNFVATTYINKLNNTIELVNGQIEKIKSDIPKELTDSDSEKLFCANITVPVSFNEDFSEEGLFVDVKDYGYFSDSSGDDTSNWLRQTKTTQEAVEKLVKQPRRALKKATEKLDRECDVDCNMIRAMNSFQMDDVRDHTEAKTDEMVSMEITNIFDLSHYREEIQKESENVLSVIKRRMKKKTTLVLGFICILLFFVSFLPLIFTNRANIDTVSTAFFFAALSVLILTVVLVITVIIMRLPLGNALKDFNDKAKDIDNDVRNAVKKYSDYLSCVANVRRGHKVLTFSENNIDIYDRGIRARIKHRKDMERVRAFVIDNYGDFISDDIQPDNPATIPYNYDFGTEKREYDYYPPYLPNDSVFIDYLTPGNKIELSSDFVSKITVRMEEIYD